MSQELSKVIVGQQEVVEQLQSRFHPPGGRGVQDLPDGLDATGLHQLGDVAALDALRIPRIDGQLLYLRPINMPERRIPS